LYGRLLERLTIDKSFISMVGGTRLEPVALPCEWEVGCLQISDMRVRPQRGVSYE